MTPTTDHPGLRLFALTHAEGVAGPKAPVPSPEGGGPNAFAGLIADLGKEDMAARGKGADLGDAVPVMPDHADRACGSKSPSTLDQLRLGADMAPQPTPRSVPHDGMEDHAARDPLTDDEKALDQAVMGMPSQIQPTPNLIPPPPMALSGLQDQNALPAAGSLPAPETGTTTDTLPKQSVPPATTDISIASAVSARAQADLAPVFPGTSDRRGKAQKGGIEQAAPDANATPKAPVGLPLHQGGLADSHTPAVTNKATPIIEIKVQAHAHAAPVPDALAAPQTLLKGAAQGSLGQGFDMFLQNASSSAANAPSATIDAPYQTGEPVVLSTTNPNWEVEFVDSIIAQVTGADAVIEIALSPETLGQIDVRVEMREGRADVTFVTETRDAARLFAQAEGRLSDLMQRHGLNLGGQDSSHRQGDQRSFAGGRAQAPKDNETTLIPKTAPEGRVNLVA